VALALGIHDLGLGFSRCVGEVMRDSFCKFKFGAVELLVEAFCILHLQYFIFLYFLYCAFPDYYVEQ